MGYLNLIKILYDSYSTKFKSEKERFYCITHDKDRIKKMLTYFPKIKEDDLPIFALSNCINPSKPLGMLITTKFIYTKPNRIFPATKICISDVELIYYDLEKDGIYILVEKNNKEEEYNIATAGIKSRDSYDFMRDLSSFLDSLVKILKKNVN